MYDKNRIHKAWKCQPPNSHSVHSWALERWAESFCNGYDLILCAFGNPAHINPLFKIELKYISYTYSIVWTRQWFPEGFLWCLSFHLNLVPKNIQTSGHVVFIIWEHLSSNHDKKHGHTFCRDSWWKSSLDRWWSSTLDHKAGGIWNARDPTWVYYVSYSTCFGINSVD